MRSSSAGTRTTASDDRPAPCMIVRRRASQRNGPRSRRPVRNPFRPGRESRSGQYTGDTHLSLLSAKIACQTGLTGSRRPNSLLRLGGLSRAGQKPAHLLMIGGKLGCMPIARCVFDLILRSKASLERIGQVKAWESFIRSRRLPFTESAACTMIGDSSRQGSKSSDCLPRRGNSPTLWQSREDWE
jgi:hypothetical protein